MWQRIQTLYLGISTILIGALFFSKVATIIGPEEEEIFIMYYEKTAYLLFAIMVFSANSIALFSFKSRLLQMRLCVLSAILLTAFQVWIGIDFFTNKNEMIFSYTAIFPIVSVILDLLAARNIALDEAMVQSAYRLRKAKRHK